MGLFRRLQIHPRNPVTAPQATQVLDDVAAALEGQSVAPAALWTRLFRRNLELIPLLLSLSLSLIPNRISQCQTRRCSAESLTRDPTKIHRHPRWRRP